MSNMRIEEKTMYSPKSRGMSRLDDLNLPLLPLAQELLRKDLYYSSEEGN